MSAKYKGAFCEAVVKKVNKSVRCKVVVVFLLLLYSFLLCHCCCFCYYILIDSQILQLTLRGEGKVCVVSDDDIKGPLKVTHSLPVYHWFCGCCCLCGCCC